MAIKDQFVLHVLVSPIEIWEILMEWNQGIVIPRQKLRIGSTGNAGAGNPAINALWGAVEEKLGNNSIGEAQEDLVRRGVATEIPAPTYGYMRRNEFYLGTIDVDLANGWVMYTLRGTIYTDRKERNVGGQILLSAKCHGEESIRCVHVDGT